MSASEAARQIAIEVEARENLYFYARYMFKMRRGFGWRRNWHHEVICRALMRVYHGHTKRLIINIPPRYSKTELAVVNFISWCLGKAPDCEFIHTSYSGGLAVNNAANAKQLVIDPHYRAIFPELQIRTDSKAKGDWRTTAGGVVYAQGAGGTITGFGAGKLRTGFGGAIIIDDPHKPDEVASPTMREGVIEWFKNTLESRVNDPGNTPIILIMQRLHERDLAGWLLDGGNGEEWEHVSIPAIAEEDEEFRKAGEPLWAAMHPIEALRRMEKVKPFEFAGQYQQRPVPRGGAMFQRSWFEIVDEPPANLTYVRDWDLAGTVEKPGTDPDWTVGLKMGRDAKGFHYIVDLRRFRGSPHEVERSILTTAQQDGTNCMVSLKQDPGQAGKAQVQAFTRMLSGFVVKSATETGSKETRAAPLAAQCEVGNVKLVRANWNKAFLDEIEFFPFGRHDDQVDAAASAFNVLAANSGPTMWLAAMDEVERRRAEIYGANN
jgi:predicted phage terminase large subunit-like protein